MNLGLSQQLKAAFANIKPNKEIVGVVKTDIKKITCPYLVAGFSSG